MRQARYDFLSVWLVGAPAERVWDAIYDVEGWPSWWQAVTHVREHDRAGGAEAGRVFDIGWRSRVPYVIEFRITVTRVDRPLVMEGRAEGDLAGIGRWRLLSADGTTAVLYEWSVGTTKRWMNAVAPVARPVFKYNHDWVMRNGAEGLARRLGAPLHARR